MNPNNYIRCETNIRSARLQAAQVYGQSAVDAFRSGNYSKAKQYAIEAWHYASLATT